jgi:hypothetical protein
LREEKVYSVTSLDSVKNPVDYGKIEELIKKLRVSLEVPDLNFSGTNAGGADGFVSSTMGNGRGSGSGLSSSDRSRIGSASGNSAAGGGADGRVSSTMGDGQGSGSGLSSSDRSMIESRSISETKSLTVASLE